MEERELTVLFYFASDNPLAPLVVSEIKAIKDAGFQEDTNVLVYFDPMEKGAPTQLFDVNRERRDTKGTQIGDGPDPFVRNMRQDRVKDEELSPELRAAVKGLGAMDAYESLKSFVDFALEKRRANNYMLFLIGHGMVVGNDAFLPDDDPVSAVTLRQLKDLCGKFTRDGQTQLRSLALHSCSMSSIEVAYELKGKADYLLATQGTAFVNGWPYRQLLKKTLNQVKRARDAREKRREGNENATEAVTDTSVNYDQLIRKIYFLCMHNFTDFLTAGYSCDLTLCRLDPTGIEKLKEPLKGLVSALKKGLIPRVSLIKDLVLLAHWDAQSFWSENYTDLWDFCDCLGKRCVDTASSLQQTEENAVTIKELRDIAGYCDGVKNALAPESRASKSAGIVRFSDNSGSEFQYARGLSIYFPWCEPRDDQRATFKSQQDQTERPQREAQSRKVLDKYAAYDFTIEFGSDSWLTFLEHYFANTKRRRRDDQQFFADISPRLGLNEIEAQHLFQEAEVTHFEGVLKRTPELKRTGEVGGDCTCPSIKNYPTKEYVTGEGSSRNLVEFSITPRALKAFLPLDEEEDDGSEDGT